MSVYGNSHWLNLSGRNPKMELRDFHGKHALTIITEHQITTIILTTDQLEKLRATTTYTTKEINDLEKSIK